MSRSPNRLSRLCYRIVIALLVGASQLVGAAEPAQIEFFETEIRPALVEHCYECHSEQAGASQGGLTLDTVAGWKQGGDHGPAIVPGDPDSSLLIAALRQDDLEMPPEGKLPEETIANFERWVRMGAPDPRVARTEPAGDRHEPKSHWAFQPMADVQPPQVDSDGWVRTPIDRFVWRAMQQNGLSPVDDADPYALVRRAYYDLWGLPPEPQAVRAFAADPSPQAYARLIDRLLSSPQFGQRWGRHWLDVARFGESTGHERNFLYPHAWRYRDYVIAAFNQDKPFDRFVIEQLAGDLLPARDAEQRDPQRTATGFLAIGPRNLLARNDAFELDTVDDQINVTTRALMGLTVSCARCHDHKFDPISTDEYYGLAGIFLSTEPLYGTQPGTGGGNNRHPSDLVPLGPDGPERHAAVLEHQAQLDTLGQELDQAKKQLKKFEAANNKNKQAEGQAEGSGKIDQAKRKIQQLQSRIKTVAQNAPEPPAYCMGVRDAEQVTETAVRISGDPRNKGDVAARGVLQCCTFGEPPEMPAEASGRLQLARWLVDPEHPLTSRVIVNRIWMHLMGRGLVPTVDNFGVSGKPPTHPELLDWLARTFQRDRWSIKQLIKRIMTSRVYGQSADHDPRNEEIDPGNRFYWRHPPRRLDAEAIRDSMLTVSGQLNVAPPADGSVVATLGDGCLVRQIDASRLEVDDPYRSVYLPAARYFEPEILQVFDGASASLVVGQRAETNVPAQALFLLNNSFVTEQAELAAQRLQQFAGWEPRQRVERAYRWVFGRPPTQQESDRALDFVRGQAAPRGGESTAHQAAWAALVQALFASAEFRYVY